MDVFSIPPIHLGIQSIAHQLHVSDQDLVGRLWEAFEDVALPKAAYRACFVEEKTETSVTVNGVLLRSRVLRRHLENVGRVFPFVLTLGAAVDERIDAEGDLLAKYVLDGIANTALREARRLFREHLKSTFAFDKISCMAPGSLEDWPVEEQNNLFSLLPGADEITGVRLTGSCLMVPKKSVSGIYFPTKTTFLSCQLCTRRGCEARRAAYDEKKAAEYGLLK